MDKRANRSGFTLLELVLALALTTVILFTISMAVDLNLRSFDARRERLEESQLARSILRIIADDIRACVQQYEQDLSGTKQLLQQSVAGTAAGGGSGSGGAESEEVVAEEVSGELGETNLGAEEETSENTQELGSSLTLPSTPGIYGNQYQLQLDVSRLPRFDEYEQMMTADLSAGVADIPSDIKTVTYYVIDKPVFQPDAGASVFSSDVSTSTDPNEVGRGLVRRQLDRAVSQFALANGMITAAENAGDVIAPEVASIEFQYFDGVEWRLEWDTEMEGSLPVAIEIILLLETPTGKTSASADSSSEQSEAENLSYYRLLVPVATGEATTESESASEEI